MSVLTVTLWITATLTWYDPQLGGINCDHECDYLGTGYRVEEWYDRAVACPEEFPRGTIFIIEGTRWGLADGSYYCWDAGGAVTFQDDGSIVLDVLTRNAIWRDTLLVEVVLPDGEDDSVIGKLIREVPEDGPDPRWRSDGRNAIDREGRRIILWCKSCR